MNLLESKRACTLAKPICRRPEASDAAPSAAPTPTRDMSLRTRERRSSFELIAEGMRRGSSRVADVERPAADPALTDEERAALQVAVESVRGDVSPAKLIGPQISKGPGWNGGARVPDGRIFFAPSSATSVLCFDPRRARPASSARSAAGGSIRRRPRRGRRGLFCAGQPGGSCGLIRGRWRSRSSVMIGAAAVQVVGGVLAPMAAFCAPSWPRRCCASIRTPSRPA